MSEQEATMEAAASLPGECFRFECLILSLLALSLLTIVECQKSKNFDKVHIFPVIHQKISSTCVLIFTAK